MPASPAAGVDYKFHDEEVVEMLQSLRRKEILLPLNFHVSIVDVSAIK